MGRPMIEPTSITNLDEFQSLHKAAASYIRVTGTNEMSVLSQKAIDLISINF
jgi:hypothetical protein